MSADKTPFAQHVVNGTAASDSGEKQYEDAVPLMANSPAGEVWVRYVRSVNGQERSQRPRDSSVATWILEIMYHKWALKSLLDTVRSARRVLQQLCGQGRIPFLLYSTLFEWREVDLAFRVALSKDVWTCVVSLYSNELVSRRSRQLALLQAVQQKNWKFVQALGMTTDCKTTQQRVFQQLVRYDQPVLALKMLQPPSDHSQAQKLGCPAQDRIAIAVEDWDLQIAIKQCLALREYALACKCLPYLKRSPSRTFWEGLFSNCADAGTLSCLLSLSAHRQFCHKFCNILFRLALTAGRFDFVVQFCGHSSVKCRLGMKIAARLRMWEALKTLIRPGCVNLNRGLLCMFLKNLTSLQPDDQGRLVLAALIENCAGEVGVLYENMESLFFDADLLAVTNEQYLISLSQWCKSMGFPNVAFLAALAAGDVTACKQVLNDCGARLDRNMIKNSGLTIIQMFDVDIFIAWMLFLYKSANDEIDLFRDLNSCICDLEEDLTFFKTRDLLEACRNNHLRKWAVSIAIERHDWDILTMELSSFPSQERIDQSITEAAEEEEWEFIETFVPQCSNNLSVMAKLLAEVVSNGEVSLALRIMETKCVDPCQIPEHEYKVNHRHASLLHMIVTNYRDVSLGDQLLYWCISSGVSTFELSSHNCQGEAYSCTATHCSASTFALTRALGALVEAFDDGDLPLVKILYESGATSNKELFNLRRDTHMLRRHELSGNKDLVMFLNETASTPRSLLSLCRLRVSHLIGCRPGRKERIVSLPLPDTLKDFILFKDLSYFVSSINLH